MKHLEADILICGGGAAGICAAIQAARMDVSIILVEETSWLGGMLSAAGVSAIDGNHRLPSGLWGEFRQKIYYHYGGPQAVNTGWVSQTLFEPHVANKIFTEMIAGFKNVTILRGFWPVEVTLDKNRVTGARFANDTGAELYVQSAISIDATEYGDYLYLAGCPFETGRESQSQTAEAAAPATPDKAIQDLTYVATLQTYEEKEKCALSAPAGYDPQIFRGCCQEWTDDRNKNVVTSRKMLEYGRLPNNKFMINWPANGNDFAAPDPNLSRQERNKYLQEAKVHTLRFVYFIQKQLGYDHLGLAEDEYPTDDQLPLIPYIRESRRLIGLKKLTLNHILDPYEQPGHIYKHSIASGDYPIDHHHARQIIADTEKFPNIPAFCVPYECLVPQQMDGLLAAEKNISVSHIVNGCTRLQPVVMQIGQAAGAAAAICIKHSCQPRSINVRELQSVLLDSGVWLMPFTDITSDQQEFKAMQKIACCGYIKGEGRPFKWANKFYIFPDRIVKEAELSRLLQHLVRQNKTAKKAEKTDRDCTHQGAVKLISHYLDQLAENKINSAFRGLRGRDQKNGILTMLLSAKDDDQSYLFDHYHSHKPLTRRLMALMVDQVFDIFSVND